MLFSTARGRVIIRIAYLFFKEWLSAINFVVWTPGTAFERSLLEGGLYLAAILMRRTHHNKITHLM